MCFGIYPNSPISLEFIKGKQTTKKHFKLSQKNPSSCFVSTTNTEIQVFLQHISRYIINIAEYDSSTDHFLSNHDQTHITFYRFT